MKTTPVLTSIGAIGGISYGIINKKSFWTTIGFTILFSIAGGALGTAIDSVKK